MLHGHLWTLRRHLETTLASPTPPWSREFRTRIPDARFEEVELTGRLSELPQADELVVVVHGLGGSSQSGYVVRAANAALALGMDCLRIDLRGADLRGADMFHAGLGSDLDYVLRSRGLDYRRRYLLGFSIGGHVCLKYAADHPEGRCDAVAAITAPLDLDASATLFDAQPAFPYRRHVLRGLLAMYEAFVARRGPWPISIEAARKITRIRQFDDAIIAPRFGYADASDYYLHASVSHVAGTIRIPTLLVSARHDPMVPHEGVEPVSRGFSSSVSHIEAPIGGHVAFPKDVSLGQFGELGLERQALVWLRRQGALA
jgi:uncharacterized protein